jgi:molybdopterin-containing oxidoreductase family iron-sulfur binding subunit
MNEDGRPKDSTDLAAARARLEGRDAPRFWQSIEELANTKTFRNFLENEFPANADSDRKTFSIDRRNVLKLMATSVAAAGMGACTKLPPEKIVPYAHPPEEIIPGRPLFYATSFPHHGVSTGVLVESHMGRPTKVEGNPEHPGSRGGTSVFMQASILNMYDPDRSQSVLREGRLSTWGDFAAAMGNARTRFMPTGAGLRILTGTVTSPTLAWQIANLRKQFAQAKWHQWDPSSSDQVREGTRLAFGRYVNTVYHFDQADVIVSLDGDFLLNGSGYVRHSRDFGRRRDLSAGAASNLNRLYVAESMLTSTGAVADHRLALRSSDIDDLARQLAAAVGVAVPPSVNASARIPSGWVGAVSRDLAAHKGSSIVIAGEHQPPFIHALVHAINDKLGNVGKTITYTEPIEANPVNQMESLRDLVNDLKSGEAQLLVVLGANPVYNAPADLEFESVVRNAIAANTLKLFVHSGLYNDETAEFAHWHVPAAHYLESWSDGRAYDGTVGIMQPLIAPLYDSHSAHEIIALFTGDSETSSHDLVRGYWQSQRSEKGKAFEDFWETSLHDGVMANTELPAISVPVHADFVSQGGGQSAADPNALEVVFLPDPSVDDGEYANNGWLQETPRPITRITWDNAVLVSPATAEHHGLSSGSYVALRLAGREVQAGAFIVPGHADNSVTVHLGYGRRRAGNVGNGPGFNAYLLRTSSDPWIARGLQIEATGKSYSFASIQFQYTIDAEGHPADEESANAFDEHRDLVRITTMDEFRKDPNFARNRELEEDITLYSKVKYDSYAWGMSIDLNRCIGCNACVTACVAENNIAVVGKDQVARGRIMHWIRVDTYFQGGLENPNTYFEPLPCMQCENAPCEYVCPVGATTHSSEGLNDMVYNRCVGTRYCSNNCPYKVRRFNFYLFSDYTTPSLFGVRNPNVTVRSRGVMEKCTYCVQRINAAKIRAEEENRPVRDGEIATACQGACPTEAIVFGDINDPNSRVSKLKAETRNYGLLEDLNTRPRTTYLARVRNPNPELHS